MPLSSFLSSFPPRHTRKHHIKYIHQHPWLCYLCFTMVCLFFYCTTSVFHIQTIQLLSGMISPTWKVIYKLMVCSRNSSVNIHYSAGLISITVKLSKCYLTAVRSGRHDNHLKPPARHQNCAAPVSPPLECTCRIPKRPQPRIFVSLSL